MPSQQSITARQLTRAREAQFHRNGEPLQTTEAIREWVESAGLLPVYPLAQFQAPMPSFAEAVLGRTENNWVAPKKRSAAGAPDGSNEESYEFEAEDEEGDDEPEEDFAEDDDADSIEADEDEADSDEDDAADDELEPATAEGDEAMLAGDGNIPADPETMLSDDDEFAEDEGDEIAEEDRIDAGDDPLPNDLREGSTSTESAEDDSAEIEEEPATPAVNGFSPEERETVSRALARLIEDGTVVPLNLLGGTTGEPDYIVPASAFSFVYTLRGDKNWKNEPETTGAMRVSPLAVKVFGLLKEKGAMAPHKLTALLGQGITDSATLRALNELWSIQRVIPLPNADGEPAKWELITSKFLRQLKAGANAGQPTALSALLSLYLHQAIAATGDDMEIFLSPLAARSRVREVVHGLSATQQLDEIVVEGKTLLHIAGELPALPADDSEPVAAAAPQRSRYEQDDRRADIANRRERFGGREESRGGRPDRGGRPSFNRGDRPSFGDRPRKPFVKREGGEGDRERRPFQRREGSGAEGGSALRRGFQPREGGGGGFAGRERRPFAPREGREGFAPRPAGEGGAPRERNNYARPWDDERPRRSEGDGERRPFAPRGEGRPFTPREDRGERRPFTPRGEGRPYTPRGDRGGFAPREGGERRGYAPRGDRPYNNREGSGSEGQGNREGFAPRDRGSFRPRTEGGDRPFNRRPFGGDREQGGDSRGERRPFTPREGGERRPFTPREGGEHRPFAPRGDRDGGFAPRGGFDRKPGGFGGPRRPFSGDREGGERRPFTPRGDGERRPFTPREDRGGFAPRSGPGGDREGGFAPRRPFTPREGGGERRPFTPREGGPSRDGGRPSFGGGNRPAFGGRPRFDREGGGGGREGGGFGDRKRFSGEPGEGRPSFQSGAHSAGPGGAKFGGSGFGRDRGGKGAPGKFGKPGFKPSFRGPGSGPARGGAPKRRPE